MADAKTNGLLVLSNDHRVVYCSDDAAASLGLRPDNIIGRGIEEVFYDQADSDDTAAFAATLIRLISNDPGDPSSIKATLARPDPIELSVAAFHIALGPDERIIALLLEQTTGERQPPEAMGAKGQSAEAALRRLVEENAAIAEIGRIISSSLDINEVYQGFADQVLKLIPFSQLEITVIDREHENDEVAFSTTLTSRASSFGQVFPLEHSITGELAASRTGIIIQGMAADEVKSKYSCLESSVRAGYYSWLAVPLINRDEVIGALFFASTTATAFQEQDLNLAMRIGYQIAGAVANAKLNSERLRTEERIRDASRLASIGELAAGMAHEINNPLTSVLGFSQLLLAKDLPTEVQADLQIVHSSAQRAAKIVQNLLSFATKHEFHRRYLHVTPILERVLAIKSYDLTTSNISLI